MSIEFIIPGQPQQQERWRIGKHGNTYDPSAIAKEAFGYQAISRIGRIEPLCSPLKLSAVFIFESEEHPSGSPVFVKPDLDNLLKFVMDALNKVFYRDDSQIVEFAALKIYGPESQTEIVIKKLR